MLDLRVGPFPIQPDLGVDEGLTGENWAYI